MNPDTNYTNNTKTEKPEPLLEEVMEKLNRQKESSDSETSNTIDKVLTKLQQYVDTTECRIYDFKFVENGSKLSVID